MNMRTPSIPLINIDPYFSVWNRDRINTRDCVHWTGSRNTIRGTITVDGSAYCFLGCSPHPVIPQISLDIDALSTRVVFANDRIRLTALFTSPVIATDLYHVSRPVAYLKLSWESMDGQPHDVRAKLSCSEELVLNRAGEGRAWSENVTIPGAAAVKMGNGEQTVLWRSGDDVRIDWGYLYLAVRGSAATGNEAYNNLYAIWAETELAPDALFAFAYDDIRSMVCFDRQLPAYWNRNGKTITEAIAEALEEYETLMVQCQDFSHRLQQEATAKGGREYAELVSLAYRQIMAAHKLVVDENGENLFISKECFSNGCAATVDITYPSAPMFLLYNPELLKGMLRPIFRYARTDAWRFDFAPHDVGQYPILNGQVYGENALQYQMPVEECGNIVILAAAICKAENSAAFAEANMDLLSLWSEYLVKYGADPGNQLCTDDFAGHLAHNCNLSIKAIMGIAGYAFILAMLGRDEESDKYMAIAREYADSFYRRAANDDGSCRLAYDREGTFSLKYNAVWDKLWGTDLFPSEFYQGEIARYRREALPYGVPLDSREKYTKSDWLLWCACLADKDEDFRYFVHLMWKAYSTMRTRVPMTDWYYADTSEMRGFQHRAVQGGLFMKLLF